MARGLSSETTAVVAMVLFCTLYFTFSNNYFFSEADVTTIDNLFRTVSQEDTRTNIRPAGNLQFEEQRTLLNGGMGLLTSEEKFHDTRTEDASVDGLARQVKTKKNQEVEKVASASSYVKNLDTGAVDRTSPPKHSIFIGGENKWPPPALTGQPKNGCIYQPMGNHNWRFCLPVLLTISCINCGTTSLGAYLDGHASLSVGTKKEHKYFVNKCSDQSNGKSYKCPWKDYTKEFPSLPAGCKWNAISGQAASMQRDFTSAFANIQCPGLSQQEKADLVSNDEWEDVWGLDISPKYFFISGAERRIHNMMPNARFLALLRNPIDRHLSHIDSKFRMHVARRSSMRGRMNMNSVNLELYQSCVDYVLQQKGFATTGEGNGPDGCPEDMHANMVEFMEEEKSYSYYIQHFQKWFNLFGKDKFLFISDQTLHDESVRQDLINEISIFAGIPTYKYPDNSAIYDDTDSLSHASSKKWAVSQKLRQVLWDYFELDERNTQLNTVLDYDFGWTVTKK